MPNITTFPCKVFAVLTTFFIFSFAFLPESSQADVVKPALIEITVDSNRELRVDARLSLEAVLTGINGRWKNTQDAPQALAEAYDRLRKLPPDALKTQFETFIPEFLQSIEIKADEHPIKLEIRSLDIPEIGYDKVPRDSQIQLVGILPNRAQELTWYYPAAFGDNAVRVRQIDADNALWHWSKWQWIRDDTTSQPFDLSDVYAQRDVSAWSVIQEFVVIGFEHIIPKGWDHVLFVLGMFLMSAQFRPLLLQVTMFTLAHTITLGLSVYGWVSLPAQIVEPLIALSIAYLGIENIFGDKLARHRLYLVFGFGLLHGLGFASMLLDFNMPREDYLTSLIGFNIGVELGQLAVIFGAYLLVGFWFANRSWYRHVITIPASLAISVIALYWAYERVFV